MWRTLRPSAGQAQQWVSDYVSYIVLLKHKKTDVNNNIPDSTPVRSSPERECGLLPKHHGHRMKRHRNHWHFVFNFHACGFVLVSQNNNNNNNNNNNQDNVRGAVKVIAWVHVVYLINVVQRQAAADPQTNSTDLGCESAVAYRLLSSTIAVKVGTLRIVHCKLSLVWPKNWMNEWIYLSTQKRNNIETELRKIQSVDRTPRKAMPPLSEAW